MSDHIGRSNWFPGRAALLFYALEVFVLKGPMSSWLRKMFGQNRKLSPTQVEYAVTQAACRIVGSVHFLIQVWPLQVTQKPFTLSKYCGSFAEMVICCNFQERKWSSSLLPAYV